MISRPDHRRPACSSRAACALRALRMELRGRRHEVVNPRTSTYAGSKAPIPLGFSAGTHARPTVGRCLRPGCLSPLCGAWSQSRTAVLLTLTGTMQPLGVATGVRPNGSFTRYSGRRSFAGRFAARQRKCFHRANSQYRTKPGRGLPRLTAGNRSSEGAVAGAASAPPAAA
jgi:hypothetical protein